MAVSAKKIQQKFFISFLLIQHAALFSGCGPDLTRPGYTPPPDTTVPGIVQFRNAQADLLSQLRFHFIYPDFSPLSGVVEEVHQVISKYPPNQVGGMMGSPDILRLHISDLIDQNFKQFMTTVGLETRDMECARDYTRLCPLRWVDLGDGETCEGPPELFSNDQCKQVKFGGLSPSEKSAAAFACNESRFPCFNECSVKDYSSLCPIRWIRLNPTSTICLAPPEYTQPCVPKYDFKNHDARLKRKFESLCKVSWPCMKPPTATR